MKFPTNLFYTKDHEWIDFSTEGEALIGVTGYAVEQLGDIVHLDLPKVGAEFNRQAPFGTIESTKTVSDLYMPVAGKVLAVNDEAVSVPESVQKNPHTCWLVRVAFKGSKEGLLDAKAYEAMLAE